MWRIADLSDNRYRVECDCKEMFGNCKFLGEVGCLRPRRPLGNGGIWVIRFSEFA